MMIYIYWGPDDITHYELGVDDIPEEVLNYTKFIAMVEWGPDE